MSIQGDGSWSSITWPYPQVRIAGNYTIGLSVDGTDLKVYELLCDGSTWTATEVASLGAYADIEFVDVEGWGPFYVVVASKIESGTVTSTAFMRYPNGTVTSIPTSAVPTFTTLCNYNGQALISGISSSDAPWSSLKFSDVAFSGIGSFDFRPSEKGNETAGFAHVPSISQGTGITRKVKQLGKVGMVYTEDTVIALAPHNVGRGGFGAKNLEMPGIRSGNHITGGERTHLYLNSKNELVYIGEALEPQTLGYQEYMEELDTTELRMTYVPQRKRFYISDSSRGYVLTEQGLYSCHQCVTSALYYRGHILCGFFYDNKDREPRLVTDTLDFNTRSFKTIQSIETDLRAKDGCDEAYVALQFRNNYMSDSNEFNQSCWTRLNPMGIGFPIVSANEFRIMIKGVDYRTSNMQLSRLDVKYQFHDKRNIRGVSNASKTSSRPNFQ